jgi:hypothetical protein
MREKWTWTDYEMEGPPPISFEDWTITAYGREIEINELVERIKYYSERGARQLLRLIAYYGTGKSTFLYNVCYRINDRLFFGDEIEKPEEESFRHVLALYLKGPVKRREFLEYTLENGLPVPWGHNFSRDEATKKRRELWYECIRKIAFILLRKALSEISRQKLEEEAISGSAFLKEFYEKVSEFRELKTNDFIKKIDELYAKEDARVFDELGELLRYYIRMLMHPIEERVGRVKVVSQEDFETEFPRLLYPRNSGSFLSSYRRLFGTADSNLRRFTAFEKILKNTNTFVFVVIDEVEDWSKVVKEKIDFEIHDIVADAESPISMVLIFRTEALELRSHSALGRYFTIIDRFTDISLKELSLKEIEELTAAILSSARKGEMKIFPCTLDFVAELAERSKRPEKFNIRQYIMSLIAILEKSLNWQREEVYLTKDLLDLTEAKEALLKILKEEERRAGMFKPPEVE